MKTILLSVILSMALSAANALTHMDKTNLFPNNPVLLKGGNSNQCRRIGCTEVSSISHESGEIAPTLASRNLHSYYYVPDPSIPSQTRAEYVTIILQAVALLNAKIDSEEEQMKAEQQAYKLLRLVPLFYKSQYTGEITFYALVDHNLP